MVIWVEQRVTSLNGYCRKKGKSVEFKLWRKGSINITNVFVDGDLLGIGLFEQKLISKLNAAGDTLQNLSSLELDDIEMVIERPKTWFSGLGKMILQLGNMSGSVAHYPFAALDQDSRISHLQSLVKTTLTS